ncbi:MAG: D-alanyl-D-alanine carboxypeptidase [Alphaproteobacteria bacterium]|nr:D-alanyl-D-alanine carboxypeptidase [Alphaproteobacteria bacterium]
MTCMGRFDFLFSRASGPKGKSAALSFFAVFLFLCVLFGSFNPAQAKSNSKYGAIILDADTGVILYQDRADKHLHPASLTKMMTLLLTFDALKEGKLGLHDRVRISKHAASMAPSKLGLEPGSTISVNDAIYALVTKSANDVAVALAEKLGRTEGNFARMMTRRAQLLGMHGTVFKNASGLHDKQQVTTPRDMSKLALSLVRDYPQYYGYFSTRAFTYQGKTYRNHNHLMSRYAGMDGLKTGYIGPSGFNLAATAVRNDRRLIGVVFGGHSAKSRDDHMAKLLDAGFEKIRNTRAPALLAKNVPVPIKKPGNATDNAYGLAALSDVQSEDQTDLEDMVARNSDEDNISTDWAFLDQHGKDNMFSRMIGEGDYDIAVRRRIETGLIAISAQKGEAFPFRPQPAQVAVAAPKAVSYAAQEPRQVLSAPAQSTHDWAIQVGAYSSRESALQAVAKSLSVLPNSLKQVSSTSVAPVQTSQGWIFRGRLHGYSKDMAQQACSILSDCIAIPPDLYQ